MGPRLTLARVEQCLQQGKAAAQRFGVQAAIVDEARHRASCRQPEVILDKLRLYLLHERLHSRQGAVV